MDLLTGANQWSQYLKGRVEHYKREIASPRTVITQCSSLSAIKHGFLLQRDQGL